MSIASQQQPVVGRSVFFGERIKKQELTKHINNYELLKLGELCQLLQLIMSNPAQFYFFRFCTH